MKKTWFEVKAQAGKPAEIFVYQEIGAFGIGADQFIAAVKAQGDVEAIDLHINSPGGDAFAAAAMYLALKRHPAAVTVYVDGLAASAASVLAMVGDKIIMPSNTIMMIHNPLGGAFGESDDLRDYADALDKIKLTLIAAYRRSGKSDEEIARIMDAETWYTAEEAKENGFADEVIEAMDVAAFFDLSKFQNPPAALQRPPAAPPPEPAPPPTPQPSGADPAVIARAEKIVQAEDQKKIRTAALSTAAAIVQACADAGHPELAGGFLSRGLSLDQVKAELAKPENVSSAAAQFAAAQVQEIYTICNKAGVPGMAEDFIAKGATVEQVRDRLKDADKIRARCAAAKMPHRAASYIKAGVTPEEVGAKLMEIRLAMDGPEIDNHIGPDGERSAPRINSRAILDRYGSTRPMSAAELYARRNAGAKSRDELLIDAIAEKVAERQRRRW